MYGNEMIGEIERRTDGLWRPSPGSVYPTLKGLVEAGLVVEREIDGRRHATLTESGRAVAGQLPARPWRDLCPRRWPSASDDLQETLEHLLAAVDQAREIADADQRIHLIGVLEGARRAIYRVLAGAPSSSSGDTPERSD
jgi:DNA-binding PadR family transcriptional regulator